MEEAGPVMQWWWIYTTSFALEPITLALSAIQVTASVVPSLKINNSEIQTPLTESITEAQHYTRPPS